MPATEPSPSARAGADAIDHVDVRRVVRLWLPLAASWWLMAAEGPLCNAFIARLPDQEPQLAAFGSLAYPLAMLIEAPVIMLLAASTRMAADRRSWLRLFRFAHLAGAALTLLHAGIAFTPLFDTIARNLIGVPEPVVEPARTAMQWLLPWSWMIAWRRMQQGVLIRCEASRPVAIGTALRLLANVATLVAGTWLGAERGWSGAAVGAAGISAGVTVEAVFIEWATRRFAMPRLPASTPRGDWTWGAFWRFYLPLLTLPYLTIGIQPLGAKTIAELPDPLPSLAVWGPVTSLVFLTRAGGFALNEVVIALVARPGGLAALRTFAWRFAALSAGLLIALVTTPLGELWFVTFGGMQLHLAELALAALPFALTQPIAGVYQNLFQGALVDAGRTRAVTEGVVIYSATAVCLFALAIKFWRGSGVVAALLAIAVAQALQLGWVGWRSRFGAIVARAA